MSSSLNVLLFYAEQHERFKSSNTSGESSITIDEIVDLVLSTKSGYIKGIGYGPKPNTTRATQRKMAELENSLKKVKLEAASAQNELQKRLNVVEIMVKSQKSQIQDQQLQIKALNFHLNTVASCQEEMLKKMQLFVSPSSSRLEVT
ncbi:hypothetical protein T459_02224 [Capsicum annuum]|uniref:Uncharacterized protein n=1 Tax=Capsicum annuum TaxID=4072 RepID=A0A2G3AJD9_CAPAN|nr:hypothetical protein T459_02224 [Capsicum annuum]